MPPIKPGKISGILSQAGWPEVNQCWARLSILCPARISGANVFEVCRPCLLDFGVSRYNRWVPEGRAQPWVKRGIGKKNCE